MLSPRLMPLLRRRPLLLGGCQTLTSLGDHTAATVGLADDAPQPYTASEESGAAECRHRRWPMSRWRPGPARRRWQSEGSAVDAVTTMFFTLTATYPVAAGLGGGGICLVRDAGGRVMEFDFLTKAPRPRRCLCACPARWPALPPCTDFMARCPGSGGGAGRSLCRHRISHFPGAGGAPGIGAESRASGCDPGGGVSGPERRAAWREPIARNPAAGRNARARCASTRPTDSLPARWRRASWPIPPRRAAASAGRSWPRRRRFKVRRARAEPVGVRRLWLPGARTGAGAFSACVAGQSFTRRAWPRAIRRVPKPPCGRPWRAFGVAGSAR